MTIVADHQARPRVGVAAGLAELERLRPAWMALWRRARGATPFQSPDWLIPWWRHIGEGELLTIAVFDEAEGRLVGLAPLYLYAPGSGERAVFPLGIATTDYLDALAEPGWEAAVMSVVFGHLAKLDSRWDACEWPQLRPGSVLLQGAPPPGWTDETAQGEGCPVLPLPSTPEELRAVVPPRMLQNLRTARHRADRQGELRWECADERSLEEVFEALLRLHRARWAARGEPGVLASGAVQAAHRASLPGLLRSGVLRLHALRLDGAIIAALYALADRPGGGDRRVYYYLGGFDPDRAALSPGALILGHAIEMAVREGAVAFDFLRGQEAYKLRWGARDTPTHCRRLRHGTGAGAGR
jgi:CelD/BcsL family acetyltransferase involved in cellulose biosynthesis